MNEAPDHQDGQGQIPADKANRFVLEVHYDPGRHASTYSIQMDPRVPLDEVANILAKVHLRFLNQQLQIEAMQIAQAQRDQIVEAKGMPPPRFQP